MFASYLITILVAIFAISGNADNVTNRKTSASGRQLIENFEGFRPNFYRDSAGIKTIGYGHACQPASVCDSIKAPISRQTADSLLAKDLSDAESSVNHILVIRLTQNQFDALTSFTFNLGAANLRRIATDLNNRDFKTATRRMLTFTKAGNKELPGLVARRKAEVALFNS